MNGIRVPRELLGMLLNALDRDAADGRSVSGEMAHELRALLAQQQPECIHGPDSACKQCYRDNSEKPNLQGDELEVVAWQDAENPLYTTGERRQMHGWSADGYPIIELCRKSDAQAVIDRFSAQPDPATSCFSRCSTY